MDTPAAPASVQTIQSSQKLLVPRASLTENDFFRLMIALLFSALPSPSNAAIDHSGGGRQAQAPARPKIMVSKAAARFRSRYPRICSPWLNAGAITPAARPKTMLAVPAASPLRWGYHHCTRVRAGT